MPPMSCARAPRITGLKKQNILSCGIHSQLNVKYSTKPWLTQTWHFSRQMSTAMKMKRISTKIWVTSRTNLYRCKKSTKSCPTTIFNSTLESATFVKWHGTSKKRGSGVVYSAQSLKSCSIIKTMKKKNSKMTTSSKTKSNGSLKITGYLIIKMQQSKKTLQKKSNKKSRILG